MNHLINVSYGAQGLSVAGLLTITGDSELNIDHTWASAPTGVDMEQVFAMTNMKCCVLHSTVAATLVTKATGGATVNTITLAAGVPQIARTHAEADALLGATAVSFHLTSEVAAGTLKISCLFDSAT